MKPHTLSILVENKPGVLSRVAGLFTRRGYNIESLAVGTCEEPDMSRITVVSIGDDDAIEQVHLPNLQGALVTSQQEKNLGLKTVPLRILIEFRQERILFCIL